jgi:hypothetical protein
MKWLIWGVLLLLQNASFTMVSRARNSASLSYHAIAAVFSNGVWFVGQFMVYDQFQAFKENGNITLMVLAGLFYTIMTVTSSVSMHHFLMKKVEKGKRKVGA